MPLREPDLMVVLTGVDMAYKREEGSMLFLWDV